MHSNNYLSFNFFQIKEFLALYETLNYTKAARECYVTQSTLSRNIQSMENILGIQLFIRNTVKVTPTPAARSLYAKLKQNYSDYEAAIFHAYQVQECKTHPIIIGINDGMDIMVELLPFIRSFTRNHPDFEIHLFKDFDFSLEDKLESHECDIVLDFTETSSGSSFIKCIPFFRGPLMLYFLKTNPLAEKGVLTLQDLKNQQLLVRSPTTSNQVDYVRQLLVPLQVEPVFSPYVYNALDLSLNIHKDNQAILADGFFNGRFTPYLDSRIIQNTESLLYLKWISMSKNISDVQILVKELLEYFSTMLED